MGATAGRARTHDQYTQQEQDHFNSLVNVKYQPFRAIPSGFRYNVTQNAFDYARSKMIQFQDWREGVEDLDKETLKKEYGLSMDRGVSRREAEMIKEDNEKEISNQAILSRLNPDNYVRNTIYPMLGAAADPLGIAVGSGAVGLGLSAIGRAGTAINSARMLRISQVLKNASIAKRVAFGATIEAGFETAAMEPLIFLKRKEFGQQYDLSEAMFAFAGNSIGNALHGLVRGAVFNRLGKGKQAFVAENAATGMDMGKRPTANYHMKAIQQDAHIGPHEKFDYEYNPGRSPGAGEPTALRFSPDGTSEISFRTFVEQNRGKNIFYSAHNIKGGKASLKTQAFVEGAYGKGLRLVDSPNTAFGSAASRIDLSSGHIVATDVTGKAYLNIDKLVKELDPGQLKALKKSLGDHLDPKSVSEIMKLNSVKDVLDRVSSIAEIEANPKLMEGVNNAFKELGVDGYHWVGGKLAGEATIKPEFKHRALHVFDPQGVKALGMFEAKLAGKDLEPRPEVLKTLKEAETSLNSPETKFNYSKEAQVKMENLSTEPNKPLGKITDPELKEFNTNLEASKKRLVEKGIPEERLNTVLEEVAELEVTRTKVLKDNAEDLTNAALECVKSRVR